MAALDVRGLRLARAGFSLDFDLSLPDGELGVILGPSGCGKSTALRLIAGLAPADSGSVRLGGRELQGLPPERRHVGLVFQDLALFGHMSARKNIEYGPRLSGARASSRHAAVEELARAFGIEALLDRYPAELSGGERQRVALARSLAARPELLLLDEPLSALDASLRRGLRAEIRERIKAAGIPALHVTHDIEEALALADRLFLMRDGRVAESGRPEEVFDHPRTEFAARLLGRGPVLELDSLRVEGREASGETAFGRFACSAPEGLAASGGRASGWRLHFAGAAGRIAAGRLPADGEPRPGETAFSATLAAASYAGDSWRLGLVGRGGAAMEVMASSLEGLAPGQEVVLILPSAALSLVQSSPSRNGGMPGLDGTSMP